MLDESLDIIDKLWSGIPCTYRGNHYKLDDFQLKTVPIQKPRIPLVIAGSWPNKKPFLR